MWIQAPWIKFLTNSATSLGRCYCLSLLGLVLFVFLRHICWSVSNRWKSSTSARATARRSKSRLGVSSVDFLPSFPSLAENQMETEKIERIA